MPYIKSLLALIVLSATLPCAARTGAPAQPPRSLHYRFDLHDPAHPRVTLDLSVRTPGSEPLLLPSHWAGQTELYRAVSNLHTLTPDASLVPTASPARFLLHTRHSGSVTLVYDLSQDWSGSLRPPLEHRAILSPDLFEFNGENGLVAPAIPRDAPVGITFDFNNLPASQSLLTSFGTAAHQHFAGPWAGVRNALFTGGDLTTQTLDVDGSPVLLALHGSPSFNLPDIALRIRNILSAERHLWHDTAIPYYAMLIAPYGDTVAGGGGGSSFTNVFNLFLAESDTFSAETASLVAHEAFHHWNPNALGAVEDTSAIAWFSEGFTSFFGDTLLQRAAVISEPEYIARLNVTIRNYLLSPLLRATNPELERISSSDHFAYGQPYLRGSVIALWLSSEIDRQTSGRHTLKDLMLALRADRTEPLTPDRIFSTAGRFVDRPTVDRLRSFALDGLPVLIPSGALGHCIAFHEQPAWTFNLGFDTASLRPEGVVQGTEPDSSAWQAGVRDGQHLGGFSLWNGNAEREVTLTLQDEDGRRRRLTFLPRGKLLPIVQAEPIPGCRGGPRIPE